MKLEQELLTETNNIILSDFTIEDIGDDHLFNGLETPIKKDAFKLSDAQKSSENVY